MKMFIFDSMANQRSAGALLKSLCRLFSYLSFISFFSAFLRDIYSGPQSCGLYRAPWLMDVFQFRLMWRKYKIK